MNSSETLHLTSSADDIDRASQMLHAGGLVAFPTETVYGLGADARNARGVAGIFAAKDRPSFNPLIVHVADIETAQRFVQWNAQADMLARAFWPGPLSLVLPLHGDHPLCELVLAGHATLAVRVPAHPTAQALLRAFDGPIAAPSANPSGRISPTTADHVRAGLAGRIDAIVDDGACAVGLESTIIGLFDAPTLLRAGGVPGEQIEAVLGQSLHHQGQGAKHNAPGQMDSHYAPGAPVRLNASHTRTGELFLGFGPGACDLNLSERGDLVEAAANLFGHLHALDAKQRPIAVAPVPDLGLGRAINDRLRRAAAPRP
ncbi:MAG: L-threonylcarbamoyladenylate synthase [Sedimentitalea sp.]